MNPRVRQSILEIVRSFRPGAPITVQDVRAVAGFEKIDLSGIRGISISRVIAEICDPGPEARNGHERIYWYRRAEE